MENIGLIEFLFLVSVLALLALGIVKKKKAYKKERDAAPPDLPEDDELVFVKHKRLEFAMVFKDYYEFWKNISKSEKNARANKVKKHIRKGKLFPTYYGEEKVWVEVVDEEGNTSLEYVDNNPPKVIWTDPEYAKQKKLVRANIRHKVYGI